MSFLETADFLRGIGRSYELDLVVLPEHGVQGAPRVAGAESPLTFPEEFLDVLAPVCRRAGFWVAASVSAGATRDDPRHQMVLMDDRGDVVARHSTGIGNRALDAPLRTAPGPGGLTTALVYGDRSHPFLVDQDLWGAELVIQYWASPGTSASQVVQSARSLAWSNTCFVISANAAGTDGTYRWSGHSTLVDYDGAILGLCGDVEYELQSAQFSIAGLRQERTRRARSSGSAAAAFRGCSAHQTQSVPTVTSSNGSVLHDVR